MSQAAFSLLTAGLKFKGLKESEKKLFKRGSKIFIFAKWRIESVNDNVTSSKSVSDVSSSIDFFNYSSSRYVHFSPL